ncbi:disks large-associated protein 5 isoform 2-T2 [Menidia menidia]
MESRFSHLRQRDTSVAMLRVKMSRRRSQSVKENRERAVNTHRQLDKLQELEVSCLNASIAAANMSMVQKAQNNSKPAKTAAQEERMKQLERWKERKALEKEKDKRVRERKGVFKTGVYQHNDNLTIVTLPAAAGRPKEKKVNMAPAQSTRVTRSMKQQQHEAPKPLKMQDPNVGAKKVQPAARTRTAPAKPAPTLTKSKVCEGQSINTRALSTRSANRPPVSKAPVGKDKPKDKVADVRTTRTRAGVNPVAPPSGGLRNCKAVPQSEPSVIPKEPELEQLQTQESEEMRSPPSPPPRPSEEEDEDMVVDQAPEGSAPAVDDAKPSFAPEGFVFQAPAGLSTFKFEPLTPRSADAFLTPSSSFNLPPPVEPEAEPIKASPPKTPQCSPKSSTVAPLIPGTPLEANHDVPYFRSEMAGETARLTSLCVLWEPRVEDESIPEEMRDRMRTAIGQARLLMKERFGQFGGLVDDCELGRGEKITTCTDLQGFWDMVYYQVEDVQKKFEALKNAEGQGWVEEHKPPPRQRKAVKKPSAAPAKPTGTKAAAKSRLAAIKAALKARQQAAGTEGEAQDAAGSQNPPPQAGAPVLETVVFNGGFFQVESPAKPSVRRSSRLSTAVLPQSSPCSARPSPRRVARRSVAPPQTPAGSPAPPARTPAPFRLTLEATPATERRPPTPQQPRHREGAATALRFSPAKEAGSPRRPGEGGAPVSAPATPGPRPPTGAVEKEQGESNRTGFPVTPRLRLSPCRTPPRAPEPPAALSFVLTPTTPAQPPISSPAASLPVETPNSSALEEIPGLDFERYLQPSQRGSLSPRETVAGEGLSPAAADVEMESPRGGAEELLIQQEPGPDGGVRPAPVHPGPEGPDTPVRLSH